MALPSSSPERQLRHRRSLDVQVFLRGDGLWEVDAHLTDVKTRDVELAGKTRAAGTPIHDMSLRLVINESFDILDAGSLSLWMPYPGQCDGYGDPYQKLTGLNLLRGFRQAVSDRLGGTLGCTHLTELCRILPTAVIQAFAGDVLDTNEAGKAGEPPFQIDRCQALRAQGDVVRLFYPRWHRRTDADLEIDPQR